MEYHGTWEYGKSSMEFHGTPLVIKNRHFGLAWILVELGACIILIAIWIMMLVNLLLCIHFDYTIVQRNSIELGVGQFRWPRKIHGIPRNFPCHHKWVIWSCSDPYGTWSKYNSQTLQCSPMEFRVGQFRWHKQFHGIPQNFKMCGTNHVVLPLRHSWWLW